MRNPKREMLRQLCMAAEHAVDKHELRLQIRETVVGHLPAAEFFRLKAGIERWWHTILTFVAMLRAASLMEPHDHADHRRWRLSSDGVTFAERAIALDDQALAWRSGGGEKPWHRAMTRRLAAEPKLVLTAPDADLIRRRWCNSIYACDGVRLWRDPRCVKRPDVVYELVGGVMVCVEVEPQDGVAIGIVQLSEYVDLLRREALLHGIRRAVRPILIVPSAPTALMLWQDMIHRHGIEVMSAPGSK